VNQGVGTAIRFLQEAVGAQADGEIGPLTRAAIAQTSIETALTRYAEIRRRRYRALSHFWRFGRGWLKRVDRTLARAQGLLSRDATQLSDDMASDNMEGDRDMTSDQSQPAPAKWWGESMTIWGTVITGLATVLPALGPLVGIDITGDLVQQAGDQVVSLVQAIVGLAGTAMTIYGRVRATGPLTRRVLSVKL
jgi:lysozyme family protein